MTIDNCLEILRGLYANVTERVSCNLSFPNDDLDLRRAAYRLALEDAIIKINQKRLDDD